MNPHRDGSKLHDVQNNIDATAGAGPGRGVARAETVQLLQSTLPGVEATVAETSRHFAKHTHDQFGIGLVIQGGQRSASGRGVVEALRGDAITVNPGEVHDGMPLDHSGRSWRMLYFDPALVFHAAAELLDRPALGAEFERPVVRDAQLEACFVQLFRTATSAATGTLAGEVTLCTLLQHMLTRHATVRAPRQRNSAILRARQCIDDDPASNPSLSDLAELAGLNRFQLLRSFVKETGLPPHAYLVQRRTLLARELIVAGVRLVDAAAQAGFSDQSHMNRAFMRFFGYTPARFAASVRKA